MPPSPTPRPNHAVDQARCRHSGQGPPLSHHDRPRLASGHRPPSALSPLAAAEVLCSGGSKCHLFKWVKARDEWRKNKVRRGRFCLYNLRSLLLLSCTNHRCPLAPPRPWRRQRRCNSSRRVPTPSEWRENRWRSIRRRNHDNRNGDWYEKRALFSINKW